MKIVYALFLLLGALGAHAKLNVVATLPDFGSIAREIGGDHVTVTSIARGTEDPHFVDARPRFVRVLNQADVLIEGGADMEIGWLPALVQTARNSKILADAPGHLVLAGYVQLLDIPAGTVDRSMGDVHPGGNPHFWLDPENGKIIATRIAETFAKVDPAHASDYQANARKFVEKVGQKLADWVKRMEPFRDTKIITYHKSLDYFARRFGLTVVGQLEPKPGIEPTAAHINGLVQRGRTEGVRLVLIETFRPRRTPQQAADALHAKVVLFPDKVGSVKEASDYFALFDHQVALLSSALSDGK